MLYHVQDLAEKKTSNSGSWAFLELNECANHQSCFLSLWFTSIHFPRGNTNVSPRSTNPNHSIIPSPWSSPLATGANDLLCIGLLCSAVAISLEEEGNRLVAAVKGFLWATPELRCGMESVLKKTIGIQWSGKQYLEDHDKAHSQIRCLLWILNLDVLWRTLEYCSDCLEWCTMTIDIIFM